jgi:hypothetical protein
LVIVFRPDAPSAVDDKRFSLNPIVLIGAAAQIIWRAAASFTMLTG